MDNTYEKYLDKTDVNLFIPLYQYENFEGINFQPNKWCVVPEKQDISLDFYKSNIYNLWFYKSGGNVYFCSSLMFNYADRLTNYVANANELHYIELEDILRRFWQTVTIHYDKQIKLDLNGNVDKEKRYFIYRQDNIFYVYFSYKSLKRAHNINKSYINELKNEKIEFDPNFDFDAEVSAEVNANPAQFEEMKVEEVIQDEKAVEEKTRSSIAKRKSNESKKESNEKFERENNCKFIPIGQQAVKPKKTIPKKKPNPLDVKPNEDNQDKGEYDLENWISNKKPRNGL